MTQVIDRRLNGKNKSVVNRQRFIQRHKKHLKKAVAKAVTGRSIKGMDAGESVSIPAQAISEPMFHHGSGGRRDRVLPGNREFAEGDQLPRPQGGAGQGSGQGQASNQGEGEDDFVFQLSREEFLDIFFEDLALPNLVKRQFTQLKEFKWQRAGHTNVGQPTNIDIVRSLKGATARRIALGSPYKRKLRQLQAELEALEAEPVPDEVKIQALKDHISRQRTRLHAIPFIDPFDLRFNNRIKVAQPSTQAVMFCLMDISGSMDQSRKDIAKRFFILLYLFLTRTYENVEVVFIRHHTQAKEVDEDEFFYSQETGGTVVSSALKLMLEIMHDRYPANEWNIYGAQASDGDNWGNDSANCQALLAEQIMPLVQFYSYVEITSLQHQSLWYAYEEVGAQCEHFAMKHINGVDEIYPVFAELFKRREA